MRIINLKFIIITVLFCVRGTVSAQNIIEKDTVLNDIIPEHSEHVSLDRESMQLSPDLLDRNSMAHSFNHSEGVIMFPKFEIDPASRFRIDHETVRIIPYQYSFSNPYEGLIMQGVSGHFVLNDFLTASMNVYVSSMYFGPFQPNPYINGALRMNLVFKIHDRVQLVGLGQVAVREGINPALPAFPGGANYYGAGMQIKVTDKIGIGFGVTNSYYRKNWTARPYVMPVFYPF